PSAFDGHLDADEQRGALAHELAHVARRDPEWMLLAGLAGCICWFQPLNLVARQRLRDAAEYLSDAWAVRHAGSAGGLASGLTKVASWMLHATRPLPVGTSAMTEGGHLLVRRVERLLRERRIEMPVRTGVRLTVAVLVCVVAAGAAPRVGWSGGKIPAGLLSLPGGLFADTPEVIRHPDPSQPLAERWDWAGREAARRRLSGYWIAYGIERPARHQGEAIIGDTRGFDLSNLTDGSPPLGLLLFGGADADRNPHRVAVLFHVSARRPGVFDAVATRTLSISFDARRDPIVWLGLAPDAESVPWLEGLIARAPDLDMRREIVDAVAFHRASDLVLPALDRILGASESELRAEAAEGLAYHDSPEALRLLERTLTSDANVEVRREAAEALGESRAPGVLALMDRALRTTREAEVRAEAAEALAHHEDPDALRLLDRTIAQDLDEHVRREAVEALGESKAPGAMARLHALVRSSTDPAVRREAIESIGEQQTGDPLATLLEILETEIDAEVIDEAVETLGDLPEGAGTPTLVRLAERHDNVEVRARALEMLGDILSDKSSPQRDAAFATLERVALYDREPRARLAATEALSEGGDARSRALLRRIARDDPDEGVREEALDALDDAP
ncbi:MAG TPA: HEAT repeat domain-containing protein, partial [Rhodothermales bacterium]|nr:HEAT repeat domain-containing protein [Rhodothermales bacterium]